MPDECDVARCTAVWDGFQNGCFTPSVGVNGLNCDGDDSAWASGAGASAKPYGCEDHGFYDYMIEVTAPDSTPEGVFLTSENFETYAGALPEAHAGTLSFRARIDGSVSSKYDWEFFIYDAISGAAVAQLEFSSTESDDVPYPGHILVNTNTVDYPLYADTGVATASDWSGHHIEVALDNTGAEAEAVRVYVEGELKVTTHRLEPDARRMDYFDVRLAQSSPSGTYITYFVVDAFDLCVSRIAVPPSAYDCNGNGQLDECDIAEGLSRDCDGNGVPDECQLFGDLDGDGDVDLFDYASFTGCITGPGGGPVDPGCEVGDFDCDEDVDLSDFYDFQRAFDGS